MKQKKDVNNRLPRTFHDSFLPERQYIHAMLRYAASGQNGDEKQISAATGIPTGKSTGKVLPILNYCRAMGLIRLTGAGRSATRQPELTHFGRVVFLEDPYLKESVTQWIAHLNMCSPLTGAEVWFQVFFNGTHHLGISFTRQKLKDYLNLVFEKQTTNLIGPMIRMYTDEAGFRNCSALEESQNQISRKTAPTGDEMGFGYGAWLVQLIADHFPKATQVTVTELDSKAGWRSIPDWSIAQGQQVLAMIERKGIIHVDRLMEPWIVQKAADESTIWKKIYDDLI